MVYRACVTINYPLTIYVTEKERTRDITLYKSKVRTAQVYKSSDRRTDYSGHLSRLIQSVLINAVAWN